MAVNAPTLYGKDLACLFDADELFTPVVGIEVVRQDAYHRLTTDNIQGPGGEGWGYDIRRLQGKNVREAQGLGPTLTAVLTSDERIETADVTITATTTNGLADLAVTAICTTALGPFTLVMSVAELTAATIEEQAS